MAEVSHHEEEQLGKLYDRKLAWRLLRYLSPYKHLVMIALVLTMAVNLVRQAGPLLTKWAIDDYITPAAGGRMPFVEAYRGITILTIIYVLSLLVTLVVGYLQDL